MCTFLVSMEIFLDFCSHGNIFLELLFLEKISLLLFSNVFIIKIVYVKKYSFHSKSDQFLSSSNHFSLWKRGI